MAKAIYTIGYTAFPEPEQLIRALKEHGVQILIDVRSTPFSAYYEAFNREPLSAALARNGIYYVSFARQFGARQEDRSFYRDGRLDFEIFARSPQFLEGVEAVERSRASVCLMCAEKDPSTCHRAILVSRAFHERGDPVSHITADGLLDQRDIEQRLLEAYFPERDQATLFSEDQMTERERIEQAYRLRNDEIGFREEDL